MVVSVTRLRALAFLTSAVMLAGCAGGTRSASVPATAPPAPVKPADGGPRAVLSVRVTIPPSGARATNGATRFSRYVSPATAAIAIGFTSPTVNAGAPATFNANLTAGSQNCTAVGVTPVVCSLPIALVPAVYSATMTTYDAVLSGSVAAIAAGAGIPTGNALSSGQSATVNVSANVANTLSVILGGIPVGFASFAASGSQLVRGGAAGFALSRCATGVQGFTVATVDADGNVIAGPGAPTVTATTALAGVTLSAPSPASPTLFGIQATNYPAPGSGLLALAASTVNVASPSPAPLAATIPIALSPSNCGVVTTFAGGAFTGPVGVTVDTSGTVYVANTSGHTIVKITQGGVISTLAGAGYPGSADGTGTAATFYYPYDVAADTSGNVYVADAYNNEIRKIVASSGVVTTLAGNGTSGYADGTGSAARFATPNGVTVDTAGNVYVADTANNRIRKITPAGVVVTLAGSGTSGNADGFGIAASFNFATRLTVDATGSVFVSDTGNQLIRKISPPGSVTTFAGSGATGSANGTGTSASFSAPRGIGVDALGNVYVAETDANLIRKITAAGVVTTLAGSGLKGNVDGIGTAASFNSPQGGAADAAGNFYVVDNGTALIRLVK